MNAFGTSSAKLRMEPPCWKQGSAVHYGLGKWKYTVVQWINAGLFWVSGISCIQIELCEAYL